MDQTLLTEHETARKYIWQNNSGAKLKSEISKSDNDQFKMQKLTQKIRNINPLQRYSYLRKYTS